MQFRSPLLLCCLLAACNDSNRSAPSPIVPGASNISVRVNDNNVLAAFVGFDSQRLVSARVLVSGGGEDTQTPRSTLVDGRQEVLVLGLLPLTDYVLTLEAETATGALTYGPFSYRTPALPSFLTNELQVRAVGTSSGGYTLTNIISLDASRHYVFAFDDRGRIRWYRHLPGNGAYAEQLPNGNYVTFMGFTTGLQDDYGYFLELSPAGNEVRRYEAPRPYYTDNHELLLTPASGGGYMTHLFSYDRRVIDTTRIGGNPNTTIAGHQILRLKPNGEVDFRWDAWNHFVIEDWIEEPAVERTRPEGDFDHPNSLAFDLDGNYIASWRNMAEITKIDATTGQILWRFGGRNNQFTIVGDPLYNAAGNFAFCGQHSVQVLANGNLLVFDNGLRHTPPLSRAVEYALDVPNRRATMVWEFRHNPSLYTPFTGSVERLANGNTCVAFAFTGAVVEVAAAGNQIWEAAIVVNNLSTINYRLKRIQSLYGVGR